MSPRETTPLPLSDTLRDLAILRASDVNLSAILPSSEARDLAGSPLSAEDEEKRRIVERSYEFVQEARAAMRILNRDEVEKQGARVDDVRNGLEEVLNGLRTWPRKE